MEITTVQRRCGLSLQPSATLEAIDEVCVEIKGFLEEWQLDRWFFEVSLLAREALINAVVHGCGLDPAQRVLFMLAKHGDELEITVEDPGPGFDWKAETGGLPDLTAEHGRGLLIFRNYATGFAYNDKGNRVTLRKAVAP